MHIVRYQTDGGDVAAGVLHDGAIHALEGVDRIAAALRLSAADLRSAVESAAASPPVADASAVRLLPPLDGRGEVWCAGVTYARSRGARMEESSEQSIYDRVYSADRPELFPKSPAWRVVTDGEPIGIRDDSGHDVPEPELAVVVNRHGETVGYTVCNDVSSRSIEGENPLYIPQAKVFAGGCALATGIRPAWEVDDPENLRITLAVHRDGDTVFEDSTSTATLARPLAELVEYLWAANEFPDGAVLATGTGIVPEMSFALHEGDRVEIEIEQVGRLANPVRRGKQPFAWLSDDRSPSAQAPKAQRRPLLEEAR